MSAIPLEPSDKIIETYKDFTIVAGVHTIHSNNDRICYVTITYRGLKPIYVAGSRYPLLNFSNGFESTLDVNKLSAILDAETIPKGYVVSSRDVEELYKKIIDVVDKLGSQEAQKHDEKLIKNNT